MNAVEKVLACLFVASVIFLFVMRLARALLHAQALVQHAEKSGGEL